TFYTQVRINGPFTSQVICSDTSFGYGFNTRNSPGISRTLIHFGQIWKPDIRYPVITNRTIGRSYFEVIQPRSGILHKFITCWNPTNGYRRKESILPAWLEVFRTCIPKVYIQ